MGVAISTHAPRTGSDPNAFCTLRMQSYFNPRSPHGERPERVAEILCISKISTHAPRTGSDNSFDKKDGVTCDFNPRSPHGERHGGGVLLVSLEIFQPTLPARGATKRNDLVARGLIFQPTLPARGATVYDRAMCALLEDFNPRSPHGERRDAGTKRGTSRQFQPTLPARGATRIEAKDEKIAAQFQPTLPARGATSPHRGVGSRHAISTHAPRTGSDRRWGNDNYFFIIISTHAPRTGSDMYRSNLRAIPIYFNPRSPHGERPLRTYPVDVRGTISTHAPRTGSDALEKIGTRPAESFQPTLPARGATGNALIGNCVTHISTHAPRTGSDPTRAQ